MPEKSCPGKILSIPPAPVLLMSNYAARKRAKASACQCAPASVTAGDGRNARSSQRAKGSSASDALLGSTHIGACYARSENQSHQSQNKTSFHFFSPPLKLFPCLKPGLNNFMPDHAQHWAIKIAGMLLVPLGHLFNDLITAHVPERFHPALFKW